METLKVTNGERGRIRGLCPEAERGGGPLRAQYYDGKIQYCAPHGPG